MITKALLTEKRWPEDSPEYPPRWNRVGGLIEMMDHITKGDVRFAGSLPLRICEVGVANGVSAEVFESYGVVDAVDVKMWEGVYARFADREDYVHLIEKDSLVAAADTRDGTYDMVYLDSRHDEEWLKSEIAAWIPKIKSGGWLCGHDYSPQFVGVQKAVADLLDGPDLVFGDSSWVKKLN